MVTVWIASFEAIGALQRKRLCQSCAAVFNLYKATISMQNKQECVAWGVTGISQLFKEPLVHSMHVYFT